MKPAPTEAENLLGCFVQYARLVSAEPFGAGHINDTFKIVAESENGKSTSYLLQRINRSVFKQPRKVMDNIVLVALVQLGQDYPLKPLLPFPLRKSRTGATLCRDAEGSYWRLFPFFENTFSFDTVASPELAHAAAEAFGRFVGSLAKLDTGRLHTTIPGFHDGLRRLTRFKRILPKAIPERMAEARSEAAEILNNQHIFNEIAALGLPRRAVHHDTKINNLLFDEITRQPLAVVDLDTVMPGIVLSDFGDMMRTFTCSAGEDEADLSAVAMRMPFYKAILDGYLSGTGGLLTQAERANLPEGGKWLTLMQAMRFLGDYLEGDVYYKTAYPEHNLVRARNQLALFRSMSGQLG